MQIWCEHCQKNVDIFKENLETDITSGDDIDVQIYCPEADCGDRLGWGYIVNEEIHIEGDDQ